MTTLEAQDRFVELRAQGWTLGHIATELHYSKRTLVEWNRLLADEVNACRAAETEALKEKFLASREEDLNRLCRLQKDVEDELAHRPLKFIPIDKLFKLAADLRKQIQEFQEEPEADMKTTPPRAGRRRHNGGTGHSFKPQSGQEERETETEDAGRARGPSRAAGIATPAPSNATQNDADNKGSQAESHAQQPPERLLTPALSPAATARQRGESVEEERETAPQTNPQEPRPNHQPSTRQPSTPPPSTPAVSTTPAHEHCLCCGNPLPALLPNGQRPFTHCQDRNCGNPLPPPGTSLREHCPKCGHRLRVHGPNAERPSNTCPVCYTNLPPLDRNSRFPWIPPSVQSTLRIP